MGRGLRSLPSTAALLLVTGSHAYADDKLPPIQNGTQWIGAFFDLSWRQDVTTLLDGTQQGDKDTNVGGDVSYGYCLTRHWCLALDVGGIYHKKTSYQQDITGSSIAPKTTDKNLFVAPTARYYVHAHEDTFFFLQASASVHAGTEEQQQYRPLTNSITTTDFDQVGVTVRFAPGISVFLSEHLAAEALIGAAGFSIERASDGNGIRRKRDNVEAGIFASSINIGIAYYFTP